MKYSKQEQDKASKPKEHASQSPHFERRKYPYLSNKIFANKKPKVWLL